MKEAPALLQPAHSLGGEFHCLPCNYSSEISQRYRRHLKSQKHQRMVAESRAVLAAEPGVMDCVQQAFKVELEEEPSSSGLYQCLLCEYSAKDHRNYVKHLKTQKHKRSVMEERIQPEEENRATLARKASTSTPTVVTSSGRKVIPKRFIGEYEEPGVKQSRSGKRRKVESGSSPGLPSARGKVKKEKEDAMADDQEVEAPPRQWSCDFCFIPYPSPKELFTHMGRSTDGVFLAGSLPSCSQ